MTKDIDWEKVSVAANRLTWVINDAAYKAPEIREQIGCDLRLMDAIATLVELTGYGLTKEERVLIAAVLKRPEATYTYTYAHKDQETVDSIIKKMRTD